jgi:hypothetical protein
MISMVLDSISVWYDCILGLAQNNKATQIGDEQELELLQWRRMGGVVFRLRFHLVPWERRLAAYSTDLFDIFDKVFRYTSLY